MVYSIRLTVVSIVCGVLNVGCSIGSPATGKTSHYYGSSKANAPLQGAVRVSRAEILDAWYPATGAEFTAGANYNAVVTVLMDRKNVTCMAAHGYHYFPVSFQTAKLNALGDNDQFPDLAWIARNKLFLPNAGIEPAEPAYSTAELTVLHACSMLTNAQLARFEGPKDLGLKWYQIFTSIQSSAAVTRKLREFAACLTSYAVPASAAQDIPHFLAWETGLQTYHDNNASIIAIQHRWAPVFVRCASPVVTFQESLQMAARTLFITQNIGSIDNAVNGVSETLAPLIS